MNIPGEDPEDSSSLTNGTCVESLLQMSGVDNCFTITDNSEFARNDGTRLLVIDFGKEVFDQPRCGLCKVNFT